MVLTDTVSNMFPVRRVRPEIAERVREARIALDYPLSGIVRSFRGRRTQTFRLVVRDNTNLALDHQHIGYVVGFSTCASATSG